MRLINLTCFLTFVIEKTRAYARLVKLEHTVFALPFALSALLLAVPFAPVSAFYPWPAPLTVLWVVLAMVGGRTYAMALNRLADATLDRQNPRTQNREIPSGQVKPYEAVALMIGSLALLLGACWPLPLLCKQLLPLAIAILTLYSYTKRFTRWCHLFLGVALGASAIGGWLALTGQWNGGLPVLFGLAVMFWVAGFDVIYACQDAEFDQEAGLFSLPSQLGVAAALKLSRGFHGLTVGFLLAFGWVYVTALSLPFLALWGYWLATLLAAAMLVYEHKLVKPDDLSQVNEAFFMVNGQISLAFLGLLLLQTALGG